MCVCVCLTRTCPLFRLLIGDEKVCLQRKRIDLTTKKLVFQQEVFVMPDEETTAKQSKMVLNKSGSKKSLLSVPSGGE